MAKTTYYNKLKREEKFTKEERLELMFDLINSFRIVKNPIETSHFLQDLLTAKEIKNLSVRLRIAKLLLEGYTHEEIVNILHCSFATVAKVSIWLSEGGEGFKKVISKLPIKYNIPKNLPPIPIEFQLPKVLMTIAQNSVAKNQNSRLEKFLKGVDKKKLTDEIIKESFKVEFGNTRSKKGR